MLRPDLYSDPFLLISALFGLCFGSFLTMLSHRLPHGKSLMTVHSHCPACERSLGARDLVPVLSWLAQRGKCRYCGTRIHHRYPLIELATAATTTGIYAAFGLTPLGGFFLGLSLLLVLMSIIDFEHYIIPDSVQVMMGGLGIAYQFHQQAEPLPVAIAAAVGFGIGLTLCYGYRFLRHKEGLGFGDVKFLAVAGIWLGNAITLVPFLFYAGLLGVALAMLWRLLGKGAIFPFGPALGLSLFLCVVIPPVPAFFWNWPSILLGLQ